MPDASSVSRILTETDNEIFNTNICLSALSRIGYLGTSIASAWVARVTGFSYDWESVCWSPKLNIFCAVSSDGGGNSQIMTSPDGINWTMQTLAFDKMPYNSICWSPELEIFCVVGYSAGGYSSALTSSNGESWAVHPSTDSDWVSVCWAAQLSLFVAVSGYAPYVMTSPDGITWTDADAPVEQSWSSICWGAFGTGNPMSPGRFVAVATGTDVVMSSDDGVTWTPRTATSSKNWRSVCYSPSLNLYVALASAHDKVMSSADGVNWYARNIAYSDWRTVCWSAAMGVFYALSFDATVMATSPDGITWTPRTKFFGATVVCESPNLSMVLSLGGNLVQSSH